jgi:hypothetical protein
MAQLTQEEEYFDFPNSLINSQSTASDIALNDLNLLQDRFYNK